MAQLPGLDPSVVARVMRNLGSATSIVNYLNVHVRTSFSKKKMPLIKMSEAEVGEEDDDAAEKSSRLRAEELSMGYIPARAPRAQMLHGMLLRSVPPHEGEETGADVPWSSVLDQMRIADALTIFGLGQHRLSEAMVGMAARARQAESPSPLEAPASSLPPALRQELLHSRLANARQNELLKILSTLGLLTRNLKNDVLHVAMRASMPSGAAGPAVVLNLSEAGGVDALWDRLRALATSAIPADAASTSLHTTEVKQVAPPADIPAVNDGTIPPDLMRAAQWSAERALTNWQRKRLREEEPIFIPTGTPAQLEALAATVPVHPSQLESYWAAERLKGKRKAADAVQARAAAEARAEQARLAAIAAMRLDEPPARRPKLQLVQATALDAADFELEAVQAVPVDMECEGTAGAAKWTDVSRGQLVDAYAEQIEALLRSGHAGVPRTSPSLIQAAAAVSRLIDWAAIGSRLGVPASRCESTLTHFLSAPHEEGRRMALRDSLLHRLRSSPLSAAAVGAEAACVVSALGIQLDVSRAQLLPRLTEAPRVETPREVRKGDGPGHPRPGAAHSPPPISPASCRCRPGACSFFSAVHFMPFSARRLSRLLIPLTPSSVRPRRRCGCGS
jgi:hypothetical protein